MWIKTLWRWQHESKDNNNQDKKKHFKNSFEWQLIEFMGVHEYLSLCVWEREGKRDETCQTEKWVTGEDLLGKEEHVEKNLSCHLFIQMSEDHPLSLPWCLLTMQIWAAFDTMMWHFYIRDMRVKTKQKSRQEKAFQKFEWQYMFIWVYEYVCVCV